MKKVAFAKTFAVLALVALLNTGCSSGYAGILSALGKAGNLSTITQLLDAAGGLESLVGGLKNFTMLAPSDDAIAKLGSSVIGSLTDPANKDQLTNILKNHILPGKVKVDDLAKAGNTLGGSPLNLGNAKILDTIKSGPGVIHVLASVPQ